MPDRNTRCEEQGFFTNQSKQIPPAWSIAGSLAADLGERSEMATTQKAFGVVVDVGHGNRRGRVGLRAHQPPLRLASEGAGERPGGVLRNDAAGKALLRWAAADREAWLEGGDE